MENVVVLDVVVCFDNYWFIVFVNDYFELDICIGCDFNIFDNK